MTRHELTYSMIGALYDELEEFGHATDKAANASDETYRVNVGILNKHLDLALSNCEGVIATLIGFKYATFRLKGCITANGKHYYIEGCSINHFEMVVDVMMDAVLENI